MQTCHAVKNVAGHEIAIQYVEKGRDLFADDGLEELWRGIGSKGCLHELLPSLLLIGTRCCKQSRMYTDACACAN